MRADRWQQRIRQKDQVSIWRAAARGHEVNGNQDEALRCWNAARLILGLPPRKVAT